MEMDVPASNILCSDNDSSNLRKLLQVFGSVVSLEEIASAYSQAGRDIYTAGEIICNLQGSTSGTSTSDSTDELKSASEPSSEMSADTVLRKPDAEIYSSAPKPKKCSASMGTVSGVIGAEYAWVRSSTHELCRATKPVKLMSSEFPESEIWEETDPSDNAESMHNDVETFLLTMLGVGFKLGEDVIREVVGTCGYDVKKSMKKMLDMSESTLEMGANVSSVSAQTHKDKCQVLKTLPSREISQYRDLAGSGEAEYRNGSKLPKRATDRRDLQEEVLQSLFTPPERYEKPPRRIIHKKEVMSTRMPEKLVVKPLSDMYTTECKTATVKLEVKGGEHVNTDATSYDVLREAVQEYSRTMKEYYKAAADAFANGRYDLAYKLLDQGNFFWKKAQEANEKSAEKLTENRHAKESISLYLHDYTTKEAIRLVECHLNTLSGIPSIQYLKLILGVDVSTKKGAYKQLQIKKLLERKSIPWAEEENGQILLIQVDEINQKRF